MKARSLEIALVAWRWESQTDENGDITSIDFTGEKYGDEKLLFRAIAPFVQKDSYIHMVGENGEHWRWFFNGKEVIEESGRIVFEWKLQNEN